jgi:hypothetical protein
MNKTDLAYLAGVMDSDGSISIGVNKSEGTNGSAPRFFELIAIRQCDPQAVHLAQELFGGNITIGKSRGQFRRASYDWYARNQRACTVVATLRPFLRIKARQADIVLNMRAIKDRGRQANTDLRNGRRFLKASVIDEYLGLTREIRALNDSRLRDPFPDGILIEVVSRGLAE